MRLRLLRLFRMFRMLRMLRLLRLSVRWFRKVSRAKRKGEKKWQYKEKENKESEIRDEKR